jgi:hypothetical protein
LLGPFACTTSHYPGIRHFSASVLLHAPSGHSEGPVEGQLSHTAVLGEGIRLYDNPGSAPIRLHRVGEGDPTSAMNVRYCPTTRARTGGVQ